MERDHAAFSILSRIADKLDEHPRCDHEGNWYPSVSMGVQISLEDVQALFAVLDRQARRDAKPLGTCTQCMFSINGRERGYVKPCVSCKRPEMSEFKTKPVQLGLVRD